MHSKADGRRSVAAKLGAALTVFLLATAPAMAEATLKGVALIIGNGDYEHIARLPNPENDARAIEAMFSALGFDTSMSTDRDARRLKRDLEGFVEDAEGSDVAVIYYSGHGIEAGGENFLVPVDADLAALDDAGKRLVPISDIIEELAGEVPVAIVLLDACRTNPFPEGALVRQSPDDAGSPVGTAGLTATRGATALSAAAAGAQALGQVIGFAAEPGKAALDGDAGGNSPYAAAILRHLGALSGEEFGTVLRMVAEEVYLKTGGRQRPWVNESLRRLLYFGAAPAPLAGAEGEILTERRQLLLRIAALPDPDRRQIEDIAATGGVPMDALYGMLAALGTQAPKEPEELARLLRDQTERLKAILAEREALKSEDAEIRRLVGLSDQALSEGALATAIRLLDQAKARVAELDKSVDQTESDLKRRRTEFAAIYAKSAEARSLAFDYRGAADDFAAAYEQVAKWDDRLAWTYKNGEADALTKHGEFKGDKDALVRAVEAGAEAVRLSRDFPDVADRASSLVLYGNALQALGNREAGSDNLERAVTIYREVIAAVSREAAPAVWSKAWNNLGNTLAMIGTRLSDPGRLDEAAEAYRLAIGQNEKDEDWQAWLAAMNNLGKVLLERGGLEVGTERLEQARAVFEEALKEITRADAPLIWATMQNNHGNVLRAIAMRTEVANRPLAVMLYVQALGSYGFSMQEWTRERVPAHWAVAQANMANVYQSLAFLDASRAQSYLESAERGQSAAMEVMTKESAPLQWALFSFNRGRTRHSLADIATSADAAVEFYGKAADDYRAALTVMTKATIPLEWAHAQTSLAAALYTLASRTTDVVAARSALTEAAASYEAALTVFTSPQYDADRSATLHYLGTVNILLGERGGGLGAYRQAEKAYREAQALRPRVTMPVEWAYSQAGLGNAQRAIGLAVGDTVILTEARRRTQEAWDTIRPFDTQYDTLLAARIAEIDAALTAGSDAKRDLKSGN